MAETYGGDRTGFAITVSGEIAGRTLCTNRVSPGNQIVSEDVVVVESGQESARDFHFTWRRMRIRLLEADGETPISEARVSIMARGLGLDMSSRVTDKDGWITLDPAPGGEVRIQLWQGSGGIFGPVQVPAGEKEATFELKAGK